MDGGHNHFADEVDSCEDSAFEICSRYSSILSKFDVSGNFSEEAWLYKPADKNAKSHGGPSDLRSQLARYLNEPDVDNLKRSLLLHLGTKSNKAGTDEQKGERKPSAKFKRKAAASALPVRRAANAPLNHYEIDWLEWDNSDVYLLEEDGSARMPAAAADACHQENRLEQNQQLQDITDIEIAAKMQEEYLQRSVLQLAKRLAADECQCENGQANQNAPVVTAAPKTPTKSGRFNRPGRTYGIRSNTQTLRVSPININAESSPVMHSPIKYGGRSTTQTLRVSPITPHSGRTLSVPRSTGNGQKVRSQSRGTPVFSQRVIPPSPIRIEPNETVAKAAPPPGQSSRTSRINGMQAYSRAKPSKDLNQRSVSTGPNRAQNFSEAKSRQPSSSRTNVARNILTKLSALKSHHSQQQAATSTAEKPRPQGPSIVRCVAGGGITQNGTSRLPKPSFLPRPRVATNALKRKFNLDQVNNP